MQVRASPPCGQVLAADVDHRRARKILRENIVIVTLERVLESVAVFMLFWVTEVDKNHN